MTEPRESSWIVPHDHPAFEGHFPGQPILPGVVLLDRTLLAASALFPRTRCTRIEQGKFLLPVTPGTALRFRFKPRPGQATTPASSLDFEISRLADGLGVASGRLLLQTL